MRPKKIPGQCDCRYIKGKRLRCPEHEAKRLAYTEPKRPRLYAMPPNMILEIGKGVNDSLARALYFFIYLTGARISEAKDFQINRVEVLRDRINIRVLTLKQRRKNIFRNTIIPYGEMAQCYENEMWMECWNYLKHFKNFEQPFKRWGNMSEYLKRNVGKIQYEATVRDGTGYKDRNIEKDFNPHYFRICRATHLTERYGFSDNQLCKFFGWKNPEMAERYTDKVDVWTAFSKPKAR